MTDPSGDAPRPVPGPSSSHGDHPGTQVTLGDDAELRPPPPTPAPEDPPSGEVTLMDMGDPGATMASASFIASEGASGIETICFSSAGEALAPGHAEARDGNGFAATIAATFSDPLPPSSLFNGGGTEQTINLEDVPHRLVSSSRTLAIDADDEALQQEVPGYELLTKLGEGGMGVVWKARQLGLNRKVALKMIRGAASAQAIERFKIEAHAVARLRHPNVVHVYDIGEARGIPFFSLELLEGGNLDDRLKGTPQSPREAARTLATLAGAIDAAHQAGIIHRDLKPANVMFTAEGILKVTDFGLAKATVADEADSFSKQVTLDGQVMGTPSYMSPEQASGKSQEIGPHTDIYALGAILYELITGRPPFKAATAMATVWQVIHEEPIPPSKLVPRLPKDLETICLKCLEKPLSKRYSTAQHLADDVGRYLDGIPILARPTPFPERAAKWVRRHPTTSAAIGLTAAAIVGAFVGLNRYHEVSQQNKDLIHQQDLDQKQKEYELAKAEIARQGRISEARGDFLRLEEEARIAAGQGRWPDVTNLTSEISGRLQSAVPEVRSDEQIARIAEAAANLQGRALEERRKAEAATKLHQEREAELGRLSGFLALVNDAKYRDIGYEWIPASQGAPATREAARKALAVYAKPGATGNDDWHLEPPPPRLDAGEWEQVREAFDDLIFVLTDAVARPQMGESPAAQARAALAILDHTSDAVKSGRAFQLRRAALLRTAGDKAGANEASKAAAAAPQSSAADHFQSGWALYKSGRWDEAAREFETTTRLDPRHFWASFMLALYQIQVGKFDQAKGPLATALAIQSFPWLYLHRGFVLAEEGDIQANLAKVASSQSETATAEAKRLFAEAERDYATVEAWLDREDHPFVRYALLVNRGVLFLRQGLWDRAEKDLLAAKDLRPDLYHAFAALAKLETQRGEMDKARTWLDRALERNPDDLGLHRARARLLTERPSPTREEIKTALEDLDASIHRERLPEKKAEDWSRVGELLLREGKPKEARDAAERALALAPGSTQAHLILVRSLIELDDYDGVIAASEKALAVGEGAAEILRVRGVARMERGDLGDAILDFTRALSLDPATPGVLCLRGWAHYAQGALEPARQDFLEASRSDRTKAEGLSGLALVLVEMGQVAPALKAAEDSLAAARDRDGIAARWLVNAARAYAKASLLATQDVDRQGRDAVTGAIAYRNRSRELINQAMRSLPETERDQLRRELQADPTLQAMQRLAPRND